MKLRTVLAISAAVAGVIANADIDMDHIDVTGATLSDLGNWGFSQIAYDIPLSGMVLDDFNASGNVVDSVSVAFETAFGSGDLSQVKAWQISFFSNLNNAQNSGFALNANTAAQTLRAGADFLGSLPGTSASGPTYVATFNHLNLNLGATGHYWVGVSAIMDANQNGGIYVLANSAPAVLGAFTANNSVGVDPTNSFNQGTITRNEQNAAYAVTTLCTPEPISMITVGVGLLGIVRRRRATK